MTDRPAGTLRTMLSSSSALTTAVLPVFLLGALSDAIRADLGFGETAIGAAVTVLFLSASVGAAPAGRLSDRFGAVTAMRTGVAVSGLAMAYIGLFAHSWWQVAWPLAAVGVAMGLIDTGAARAFSEHIPRSAEGTAFGVKEASVPGASLLAGLALPTVAARFGWRTTFVAALAVAALVWALVPGRREPVEPQEEADGDAVATPALLRFAVGVGLGSGAATAAATFLVPAATARGVSSAAAGALLSVASLASIAVRLAIGRAADRRPGLPVRAVTAMLVVGAAGAALLVPSGPATITVVGAVLVLGAGWGWTGLAFLAAVRNRRGAPAAAAGVVLTALGAGGALGPLVFGAIAGRASYPAAWAAAAGALAVAAAATATARAELGHDLPVRAGS